MRRLSWARARSFEELCELGARFVEGRLARFPGWGGAGLDAESLPLAARLARLTRAGFWTLASQPGSARGVDGCEQRAFVSGFARAGQTRRWRALEQRGLCVRSYARGDRGRAGVAVTRKHGSARVLAGQQAFESELALLSGAIGARALGELERCVYCSIWDPVWGRGGLLWSALDDAWC